MKVLQKLAWTRAGRTERGAASLAALALWALACLFSCGQSHSESNSNTSWLQRCDERAPCDTGLECVCGRCTKACDSVAQCGAELPGASCEPTSRQPDADSCRGSSERDGKSCALGCRHDDDCAAAGAELVCRSGFCSAGASGEPARPGDGGAAGSSPPNAGSTAPNPVEDAGSSRDAAVDTDGGTDSGTDGGANPCPDGMIVATPAGCLQDDAFCIELPDGRYCTGVARATCPAQAIPIAADAPCPTGSNCWQYSESLRCQSLQAIDFAQCTELGGRPVLDPGSGVLFSTGCPLGRAALGMFGGPGEGGLCCMLTIDDCKPHDVVYQSVVCDTGPFFHWTGLVCSAHMGCCTGPDCDKGSTSEADCMQQHAGCRAITKICGGLSGGRCAADEYCAYLQECGIGDGTAICVPRPTRCDPSDSPVCSCDGTDYPSLCAAAADGKGIAHRGGC